MSCTIGANLERNCRRGRQRPCGTGWRERCRRAMDSHDLLRPALAGLDCKRLTVAFSGGMDSTVLLHLAVPAVASSAPAPHLPDLPASGKLAPGAGGGGLRRSRRNQQVDVPRASRQRVPVQALAERQTLEHQTGDVGGGKQAGRPFQRCDLGQPMTHGPFADSLEPAIRSDPRNGEWLQRPRRNAIAAAGCTTNSRSVVTHARRSPGR